MHIDSESFVGSICNFLFILNNSHYAHMICKKIHYYRALIKNTVTTMNILIKSFFNRYSFHMISNTLLTLAQISIT